VIWDLDRTILTGILEEGDMGPTVPCECC
jgi:hypothetical protein